MTYVTLNLYIIMTYRLPKDAVSLSKISKVIDGKKAWTHKRILGRLIPVPPGSEKSDRPLRS